MDATQTSDPTGGGPGSPGQASAFRRALDEQALHGEAAKEGPLDLTVPLNLAEIRAALSSSGVKHLPPAPADEPVPPLPGPRRGAERRGGHAAGSMHAGSKRLGRIGVFVALATALSVGTAAALVLSSGGQGASVSLPTTNGNIPVATAPVGGPGLVPATPATPDARTSPSASASAAASAGYRPSPAAPAPSASPAPAPSASATSQASNPPSPQPSGPSQGPGLPSATATVFTTLRQGSTGAEVTQVQQLLVQVNLLYQHHHKYYVNLFDYPPPDPSGTYGDATTEAIVAFQQNAGVGSAPGVCDQATYDALSAQAAAQGGGN